MNDQRRSVTFFRRLISLIIFLFGVGVTYAQSSTSEPAEKWWWAWRAADHSLIAFDAAGETHVIATPDNVSSFWRISDNTAIAILQMGDAYMLDKLTDQSAVPLNFPTTVSFAPTSDGLIPVGIVQSHWPYAIVAASVGSLWIVDLSTDDVQPLDRLESPNCGSGCVVFSADGRSLRYAAAPALSEPQAQLLLRERDLASSTEHNFYMIPSLSNATSDLVSCQAGTYGEHWLCHRHSEFNNYQMNTDWLVNLNGETRTLVEQSIVPFAWNFSFSLDNLIVTDYRCQQDCTIDVDTQSGQPSKSFKLPSNSPYFDSAIQLANGNLLLEGGNFEAFTLSPTGHLQELGNAYCCEAIDTESPDLHWIVLATDNGNTATVWDLQTSQVKFIVPASIDPAIIYTNSGFIIRSLDADANHAIDNWVYFNDIDQFLKIPLNAGLFVDILPDDTLLYEQLKDSKDLTAGIYRYDPTAKTYTVLVTNAELLFG